MEIRMINEICDLVKSISDGKNILKEACLKAEERGINPNSFNNYYRAWHKMLNGEVHTRSINSELRNEMLTRISKYYGNETLKIALEAFEKSINYSEETHNTNMFKDRAVMEWHRRFLV